MDLFHELRGSIDAIVHMIGCYHYTGLDSIAFKVDFGCYCFVAHEGNLMFDPDIPGGSITKNVPPQ